MGCSGRLPEYSTVHQFTSDISDDAPQPTEGGWGWAAVVGCIIIHVCTGSTDRVFGVVLVALQDRFPDSSTATLTAVNGLCIALVNFAGPITTVLMNKGVSARWILVWCEYTQRKHLLISRFVLNKVIRPKSRTSALSKKIRQTDRQTILFQKDI